MSFDDLEEPPEFRLPTWLAFDNVLSLSDQHYIAKAARYAAAGNELRAEKCRKAAGYNGLSELSRPEGGPPA